MKNFLFLLLLLCYSLFNADAIHAKDSKSPLSVVVIGGGPAGLATAIEAKLHGAKVTVVEKRLSYSREQTIFLFDDSVNLIEMWNVICPQMTVFNVDEKSKIAFVGISDLEKNLSNRATELGINILNGEFKSLSDKELKIILDICDTEICLPYDILVGADGTHSQVREMLGIGLHKYGNATGSAAIVVLSNQGTMSSETNKHNEVFIRRILTPPGLSIMFAQTVLQLDKISSQRFAQAASEAGWHEEASLIEKEKAQVFVEGIDIVLQQAQIFANERKAAILVGDAAASASFFEGMGANTAFRTAVLAGDFIADFLAEKNNAYDSFNINMKNTTDELINKSRYLFIKDNIIR